MNNINNNLYGKTTMKLGSESKQIQNNLLSEINTKDIPKQELGKLNNLQNTDIIKILTKIQEDTKRAELIAIKIVKQETVTTNEQNFINKKYPDMKQVANESINECVYLKEKISNCKTDEERQQVLFKAISDIKDMTKKGVLSEIQARIKNSGIVEVEKFLKNIQKEVKKAEIIAIKIVKGYKLAATEENFINKKYPDLKQVANQSINECAYLKEKISNCKTDEERQQVLFKAISDIKDMTKKGVISEIQAHIKNSGIVEVEKFLKNIQREIKKAEIIAIKIVKGDKLTATEENFINKKYPDIKQIADQSINEKLDLKEKLKSCKTPEEKQLVLAKAIGDVKDMAKKGVLSETEIVIKMLVIEVVKKEDEREYDKEKGLKFIINPYIYLNSGLLSDKLSGIIIIVVILSIIYFFKN